MKGRNVMKKRKLKKWVKVLMTIGVILFSAGIYSKTNELGIMAQNNDFYAGVCIICWAWLIVGQISLIEYIWEEM